MRGSLRHHASEVDNTPSKCEQISKGDGDIESGSDQDAVWSAFNSQLWELRDRLLCEMRGESIGSLSSQHLRAPATHSKIFA
jgi:hypothetical protein